MMSSVRTAKFLRPTCNRATFPTGPEEDRGLSSWIHRPPRLSMLSVAILALSSCVGLIPDVDPTTVTGPRVRVEVSGGQVVDLSLDQYVAGSILAEADLRGLPPDSALRVARTQAILARTYALANQKRHDHEGFALCSTTHCQVYRALSTYPPAIADLGIQAARDTAGQVLTHKGRPINAVYHADCGGSTSDSSVPWGGVAPAYLRGVGDRLCQIDHSSAWSFESTRADLRRALNRDGRTAVGKSLRRVEVAGRDDAGRALSIVVEGEHSREVRGEVFRAVLVASFGVRSIQSTRFSINVSPAGHEDERETYTFSGRGFGHGVGLCQRGAVARARRGDDPATVLSHYYPETELTLYY